MTRIERQHGPAKGIDHGVRGEAVTRRHLLVTAAAGAGALAAAGALPTAAGAAGKVVNIGAKDFSEPQIIARMYTLLLNHAGIPTKEHFNLPTPIAHPALLKGDLDMYPEYTGTGLEVVLKEMNVPHDAFIYYDQVATDYEQRFHVTWLNPYPMNDTQGLATTQAISKQYGIRTISDMVRNASKLRFIANSEFLNRPDGLPGLKRVYGNFTFKSMKIVAGAGSLRYAALRSGLGDVVVAFTTDAAIAGDKLVVLQDDKGYAPPDNMAPILRDDLVKAYPQLPALLNTLAPRVTSAAIAGLNYQVDVQHQDIGAVARAFLQKSGLHHVAPR